MSHATQATQATAKASLPTAAFLWLRVALAFDLEHEAFLGWGKAGDSVTHARSSGAAQAEFPSRMEEPSRTVSAWHGSDGAHPESGVSKKSTAQQHWGGHFR